MSDFKPPPFLPLPDSDVRLCEECRSRRAMDDCDLCVSCEYAQIRAMPANALFNPARSSDVVEVFYKRRGK